LSDLARVVLHDLVADGGEILRLLHRNAASQVEQRTGQWLQDNLIPSLYESDPVAFFEVERSANLPWNSHLAAAAYSANNHHAHLPIAVILVFVRNNMIIAVISANVKQKTSRCIRIATRDAASVVIGVERKVQADGAPSRAMGLSMPQTKHMQELGCFSMILPPCASHITANTRGLSKLSPSLNAEKMTISDSALPWAHSSLVGTLNTT
jgi:hypothetical protein